MPLIQCENLTMSYENRNAVENVSFSIEPGDYLCIVGENGSGKSTLLKGLLGLMRPKNGKILFGDGLTQTSIGYLPQQTVVQRDFPASVQEVVISGCLHQKGFGPFYKPSQRTAANAAMEKLNITSLRKKSYRALSGGQQQRVLLARALCATDKLLLLDEPVTGLDPVVTSDLYALLKQLNQEGVAIVMVSHDINCSIHNARKILHMNTGVLFFGSVEAYRKSALCEKFLGRDAH
ncbi:MAG: ABC transporter ATP-binding protein [Oscillospiraceae bacterium]|nr:ABC transporter ATP-binding protein [Oscillospiraceae bacterium]MCI9362648.1 ABC transporter ATP-binding protein [Oscillospiraceae bacterium]RKJ57851.1 ABC transporter ATP-binding protein [bacterium 1XD42-8]RKJ66749.1 ABC transporter ATP-binding protein [bacterium 1XD42-1]